MTTQSHTEIISAALDGERVDLAALRGALAAPEGRDALAAFLLLRAAAAGDDLEPSEQSRRAVEHVMRPGPARWFQFGPRVPASLAASLAIIAIVGAFWFGTALRAPNTTLVVAGPQTGASQRVPEVPRTVERASGTPVAPGSESAVPPQQGRAALRVTPTALEPPRPSRVLRFVPGVDWLSGSE